MKLFETEKLSYYAPNKGYSIRLKEINGDVQFSIIIGSNEAQSIALALEGIQTPRPMTHDIILDILSSSDVKIDKIEIYKFFKGTFYSRLYIKNINIGIKSIDCRPSDAIAIAIRYCCPIYVTNGVLSKIKSKEVVSDYSFNSIHEYKNKNIEPEELTVEKLNKALDSAVNKENYEVAAKIRDKIKSIEKSKQD